MTLELRKCGVAVNDVTLKIMVLNSEQIDIIPENWSSSQFQRLLIRDLPGHPDEPPI